jgi:hypothetical protein
VIATVTAALVLGWHQHEVFTAGVRVKGSSFSIVLTFLLEASVFMLIGFSLRDILERAGGVSLVLERMAWPGRCCREAWRAKAAPTPAGSPRCHRTADGVGLCGSEHSIEHGRSDGHFRALSPVGAGTKSRADDRLVA